MSKNRAELSENERRVLELVESSTDIVTRDEIYWCMCESVFDDYIPPPLGRICPKVVPYDQDSYYW